MSLLPTAARSGIDLLDETLGGLVWGDNVVLRAFDDAAAAEPLIAAVLAASGYSGRTIISFDGSARPGCDTENVGALELDEMIARILTRGAELGTGGLLVVDDLGWVVERHGVDSARRLFVRSCPLLLRHGAVAYWVLGPRVPPDLAEQIRRVTQVVLRIDGETLTVDRAEARARAVVGTSFAVRSGAHDLPVLTPLGSGTRSGAALAAVRVQRGLTQAAMAELAGVSASAISQAERGQRGLSVDTLLRLATGLGVTLDELVVGSRGAGYRIRGRMAPHRGGASRVALLDSQDEAMRVYEFRLDPGAHGSPPARTRGTEAVLLGQGLLLVTMTDGSTPVIREGEALFGGEAGIADWRNLADDDAIGFWIGV
ncbi:MAG: helix-turn-helix domain-containing protein [Gaiellales bacterium]